MGSEDISELLSSKTRLLIAELISRRPRTLRELSRLTGLSAPGVLRHLDAMSSAGLVREDRISAKELPVRKVYASRKFRVADFSVGDLSIVKVTRASSERVAAGTQEMDWLASEILVGRRRIRDRARRLARTIDEQVGNEERLVKSIEALRVSDEERFVLLTAFTEETLGEAAEVQTRIQGMKDARKAIERALAKARRSVGK